MLYYEQENHICTKEELEASKDKCNNIRKRYVEYYRCQYVLTSTSSTTTSTTTATTTSISYTITNTYTTTTTSILYYHLYTLGVVDMMSSSSSLIIVIVLIIVTTRHHHHHHHHHHHLIRYDVIVLELDEMVAEGYFIPGKKTTEKIKLKAKPPGIL